MMKVKRVIVMDKHEIYQQIEKQINSNSAKSLFYAIKNQSILEPRSEFIKFLIREQKSLSAFYQDLIVEKKEEAFIEGIVESVIQSFITANQFIHFNERDREELQEIYRQLIQDVLFQSRPQEAAYRLVFDAHYQTLKEFLIRTNQKEMFKDYETHITVPNVECGEYQSLLQIDVLGLDTQQLKEPILDIGCGQNALLVHYLEELGYTAFGFDRTVEIPSKNVFQSDWFTFRIDKYKWGTIVSHMAFSNHFIHHHYKKDGNYQDYAQLYVKIIRSLKKGGSFIYSPDLPFIEELLDPSEYSVKKIEVIKDIFTTHVTKL